MKRESRNYTDERRRGTKRSQSELERGHCSENGGEDKNFGAHRERVTWNVRGTAKSEIGSGYGKHERSPARAAWLLCLAFDIAFASPPSISTYRDPYNEVRGIRNSASLLHTDGLTAWLPSHPIPLASPGPSMGYGRPTTTPVHANRSNSPEHNTYP